MQRNTNTNDSAIRDVLFSPRGVKRQRRETLAHATTTTSTTTQTQTDPESIIEEKEEDQEDTCAICMDVTSKTKNVSVTECGHRFCTSCLLKSLQTKNACPMCRAEIEPARKPNLEQLTANVAADLIQAEERDIDIQRRIALIGAFSDPRGRGDMILSLCREFAFGTAHSIAGWQGTDDQTYHASWVDYEYNNYDDDDDETEDEDEDDEDDRSTNDGNDDGSDGDDDANGNDDGNDDNDDTEKRDEIDPPPSWGEVFPADQVFPATAESATRSTIQQIMYFQRRNQSMTQSTTTATTTATTATSQSTSQPSSTRALIHNLISGVVSYTMFYTFYYALPNLVSSLVDTVVQNVQNIRQE
jgi:hypothetical protein